ncbi:MAG: TGS domain-containing protein, partial [Fibrobacterota bacterium]
MKIILPDGSAKEMPAKATAFDLALSISEGLSRHVVAAKVNGRLCDLSTPLSENDSVLLLKFDSPEGKTVFWHTSAHIMAQAVTALWPGTKVAIGPAIDTGFYYDFDTEHAFS